MIRSFNDLQQYFLYAGTMDFEAHPVHSNQKEVTFWEGLYVHASADRRQGG
jgi:hypothetical protein